MDECLQNRKTRHKIEAAKLLHKHDMNEHEHDMDDCLAIGKHTHKYTLGLHATPSLVQAAKLLQKHDMDDCLKISWDTKEKHEHDMNPISLNLKT